MPPLELVLPVLGWVVAPAFLVAVVLLAAGIRIFGSHAAGPCAAAAFLAGCVTSNTLGDPTLPWPPERLGWHWLLWPTALAMLVEVAARRPQVPATASWLLRALTAGHAAWLLVPSGLPSELDWVVPVYVWAVPAFALVVLAEWGILQSLATELPGGTLPLAAACALLGAAGVIIHAHSARMTDIATFAAASFAGVALIAAWSRTDVGAVMPAAAVMLPGLVLSAYYETFSEVPPQAFAFVALAPLTLAVPLAILKAGIRPPNIKMVAIVLIGLPAALALAMAMRVESIMME
jgi:hypothetical protein